MASAEVVLFGACARDEKNHFLVLTKLGARVGKGSSDGKFLS